LDHTLGLIIQCRRLQRYIIKEVTRSERKTLVQLLSDYTGHIAANPESMLPRITQLCAPPQPSINLYLYLYIQIMYRLKTAIRSRFERCAVFVLLGVCRCSIRMYRRTLNFMVIENLFYTGGGVVRASQNTIQCMIILTGCMIQTGGVCSDSEQHPPTILVCFVWWLLSGVLARTEKCQC
jgi:hypothetical protein